MLCAGGVGVGDLPLGCSRVLEKRGRLTLDGGSGKLKERKRRVRSEVKTFAFCPVFTYNATGRESKDIVSSVADYRANCQA